jgi:hypothetical protein
MASSVRVLSAYSALDSNAKTRPSPPRLASAVANQTVELPEPNSRIVRTDESDRRSSIQINVDADIAQSPSSGMGRSWSTSRSYTRPSS